ncbi:hypothetical protein [Herbiconiux sp.]|uniref:hypothetical protein n=1 Tax=Herbiconiux sp. TaxID=1871186 RepID=UPI0025BDE3AE|nr:hypothetical protein [Herbiconiux sp.]
MVLKKTSVTILDFDRETAQDEPGVITVAELLEFADAVRAAELSPDDEIQIITFDYEGAPVPIGFKIESSNALD